MTITITTAEAVARFPQFFPLEDSYGNVISADDFSTADGYVELHDRCAIYVPATHPGYTGDGTHNADNVRMILGAW